ncbi:MAG: hypothetical protein A3G23_10595 [Bacteroidetes bacterium RIFCSPLOWO2_12_FULL_37_12]|nr:MAG: hypothetical protein A3G23_10595 [Bacteroidetes bacterium RIFCSPLOWO2_12_FULL_37_12]
MKNQFPKTCKFLFSCCALVTILFNPALTQPKINPKDTIGIRDLKMAYSTYCLASDLIDIMRRGYKTEGSKLFLGEKATQIYDKSIRTSLRLYNILKDDLYKNQAFQFSEKNKSSVLLASLSESKAKKFSDIPDSVLQYEKELKIDLAFYDKSIAEEQNQGKDADSAKIALWQDKLFNLKQKYDALIKRLESKYPQYYKLKYDVKTATVKDIQTEILDDRTALIEYFTGDTSIYIFSVTKSSFEVIRVKKDSLFNDFVTRMRDGIYKRRYPLYVHWAFPLYQTLLEPVLKLPVFSSVNKKGEKQIQNLLIIPDGMLGYIPFEALLTQVADESVEDYKTLSFLIKEYSVNYSYSATLVLENIQTKKMLAKSTKGKSQDVRNDFMAFAPVFSPEMGERLFRERTVPDIPATETEVKEIAKLFEQKQKKSKIFTFKDALEDPLKTAELANYKFIHFATHGYIDESKPELSSILLATDTSRSKEDGTLFSGETFNLRMNADMVTLSACETGLGKVVRGEGIMGLSRGFLYAGANSLVVSLWRVSDNSTSDLMLDLYRNILDNKSKISALREAKLKMINEGIFVAPYFWAPFILIGK